MVWTRTSFQELQDLGEKAVDQKLITEWQEKGIEVLHAQIGPKSCIYIPGGYYMRESVHSDTWGIRCTFISQDPGQAET